MKPLTLFKKLLDIVLPQNARAAAILNMTAEELRAAIGRPKTVLPKDVVAIFDYREPLARQAIWELKYRGNKKIAALLASCLYEELLGETADRWSFEHSKPLIIAIPLSKKRQRERGFNQCELLAAALEAEGGGQAGGNFFEVGRGILVKVKDTESQTKKNRAERLKNLAGCFALRNREAVKGRNVILLDDVTTTGATFEEALKVLGRGGARSILAAAVAH